MRKLQKLPRDSKESMFYRALQMGILFSLFVGIRFPYLEHSRCTAAGQEGLDLGHGSHISEGSHEGICFWLV